MIRNIPMVNPKVMMIQVVLVLTRNSQRDQISVHLQIRSVLTSLSLKRFVITT